jgi:alkylation response protein AidB-like acyl-CoA dehydrogenase
VSDARSTLYQDLFGLDGLLTEEEREVRERVRAFSDAEVIPIMADCWERGEFPFQLVPKLAALSICGDTIKGYGCAGLSAVGAGLAAMELARGDGSIYTFFGATSGFAINTIFNLGSEYLSKTVVSYQAGILACAFSPNDSRIVAASDDRTLKIWDATVCTFFLLRSMERGFMHPRCSGTQPS